MKEHVKIGHLTKYDPTNNCYVADPVEGFRCQQFLQRIHFVYDASRSVDLFKSERNYFHFRPF